ncbi:MAG TPA: holo-ACP synthase [Candidatus Avidesulfovibrio excrementigallinarum]|nr:holo-ACP synthase [Candidatus Avidesulfovibrio excrementigallinarum]
MAVIGIGLDLVERARIERALNRFGKAFLARILSPEEQRLVPQGGARKIDFVAARFAAKEAASKALGTGFANGISPRDFEILSLPSGAPRLRLCGAALEHARRLDVASCHLTLTHSTTHAAAVVILEAVSPTSSRD